MAQKPRLVGVRYTDLSLASPDGVPAGRQASLARPLRGPLPVVDVGRWRRHKERRITLGRVADWEVHPSPRPRRLTARHWRLLSLLAEHGVLDTHQVRVLLFSSRATAYRHLSELYQAGLVLRFTMMDERSHLRRWELTGAGIEAIAEHLEAAGRPVPLGLEHRRGDVSFQLVVNQFFTDMVASRQVTGGHLYRWRHRLDAAAWLRNHGVRHVDCDGYGRWIEQGTTVSFLFYLEIATYAVELIENISNPTQVEPTSLSRIRATCRAAPAGLPVDVICVLAAEDAREQALWNRLDNLQLPVPVATTCPTALDADPAGPAGAVWRTRDTPARYRLVDLAGTAPISDSISREVP